MPDWIENRITIRTVNTERFASEFLDALLTPEREDGLRHLDFEALKQCPGGYDSDWYMKHIGSDRGAQAIHGFTDSDLAGNELVLNFLTAKHPPIAWIKRLAPAFPEVMLRHSWVEVIVDGFAWAAADYQGKVVRKLDDVDFNHPDFKLPLHLIFRDPSSGLIFSTTELARSCDSGQFDGTEPLSMLFMGEEGFVMVPGTVLLSEPVRATQFPEGFVVPQSNKPISKAAKKKAAQKARRQNR